METAETQIELKQLPYDVVIVRDINEAHRTCDTQLMISIYNKLHDMCDFDMDKARNTLRFSRIKYINPYLALAEVAKRIDEKAMFKKIIVKNKEVIEANGGSEKSLGWCIEDTIKEYDFSIREYRYGSDDNPRLSTLYSTKPRDDIQLILDKQNAKVYSEKSVSFIDALIDYSELV